MEALVQFSLVFSRQNYPQNFTVCKLRFFFSGLPRKKMNKSIKIRQLFFDNLLAHFLNYKVKLSFLNHMRIAISEKEA